MANLRLETGDNVIFSPKATPDLILEGGIVIGMFGKNGVITIVDGKIKMFKWHEVLIRERLK